MRPTSRLAYRLAPMIGSHTSRARGLLRSLLANNRGPFWATSEQEIRKPAGSRWRSLATFSVVAEQIGEDESWGPVRR